MSDIVAIRFEKSTQVYHFNRNRLDIRKNDRVIVETSKGLQYGLVVQTNIDEEKYKLARVLRIATEEDERIQLENVEKEKTALKQCREIVEKEKLKMHVVGAKYSFDRETLVFSFFADQRVDFRELLKVLAKLFKARIELLQIGVRDKAKEVGGIGQCGQQLCCSRFLNRLDNISINMAKNQDLALNPNKINGACGRLLCCLNYEDEFYRECKRNMPKKGEFVNSPKGKVVRIDCLKGIYTVQTENGDLIEVEKRDGKN